MSNEITSTHEIAETEWDGEHEPGDVPSDIVATHEAEGRGIEFHVSMRDYTQRDMEALIVEAAASLLVGRGRDTQIAKKVEECALAMISEKATRALESVTSEIIDQPMTPKYGDKQPVTMREFLGLYGREFLAARVNGNGEPETSTYHSKSRMEYLVGKFMDAKFKAEIEKATGAAVIEVRNEMRKRHEAMLADELKRFRDALAAAGASSVVSVKA